MIQWRRDTRFQYQGNRARRAIAPGDNEREERRMINRYLAWAAAVGAAGCGRCAAAA